MTPEDYKTKKTEALELILSLIDELNKIRELLPSNQTKEASSNASFDQIYDVIKRKSALVEQLFTLQTALANDQAIWGYEHIPKEGSTKKDETGFRSLDQAFKTYSSSDLPKNHKTTINHQFSQLAVVSKTLKQYLLQQNKALQQGKPWGQLITIDPLFSLDQQKKIATWLDGLTSDEINTYQTKLGADKPITIIPDSGNRAYPEPLYIGLHVKTAANLQYLSLDGWKPFNPVNLIRHELAHLDNETEDQRTCEFPNAATAMDIINRQHRIPSGKSPRFMYGVPLKTNKVQWNGKQQSVVNIAEEFTRATQKGSDGGTHITPDEMDAIGKKIETAKKNGVMADIRQLNNGLIQLAIESFGPPCPGIEKKNETAADKWRNASLILYDGDKREITYPHTKDVPDQFTHKKDGPTR